MNKDNEKLEIAGRAALVLKRYLSWVDIQLATHPSLVNSLLFCLGLAAPGNARADDADEIDDAIDDDTKPSTTMAAECAQCLQEIVTRGMDEKKKEDLLTSLDIIDSLCRLTGIIPVDMVQLDITNAGSTQIDAVIATAELINATSIEVITCFEFEFTPTAGSSVAPMSKITLLMNQCLELSISCLYYDDIDVSGAVVEIISRVLVSIERYEVMWNSIYGSNGQPFTDKLIQRVLSILQERMGTCEQKR